MSAPASLMSYAGSADNGQRAHRKRLWAASLIAALMVVALAVYGWDYYILTAAERPFSAKHDLLKPSGTVSIRLGILGALLFCVIFLYPLRKRVPWLKKLGTAPHWLDFHIVFGLTAPVLIAFHASFKFRGIAGVAFWFMVSVALSGVVGRYVYAQIPRSLNSAEVSLKELQAAELELSDALARNNLLTPEDLQPLLQLPSPEQVRIMPVLRVLGLMLAYDIARPFRLAALRARISRKSEARLPEEVARALHVVRAQSSLSKRVAFLSRSQQIFHLWHVVHRPFSYSFVVLALIHIVVVVALGFV